MRFLLVLCLALGCNGKSTQNSGVAGPPAVAEVGTRRIRVADVATLINAMPLADRRNHREHEVLLERLVERLVEQELLVIEGERRRLRERPALRRLMRIFLADQARAYTLRRVTLASVSDVEVRRHYEAHPERFRRGKERLRLRDVGHTIRTALYQEKRDQVVASTSAALRGRLGVQTFAERATQVSRNKKVVLAQVGEERLRGEDLGSLLDTDDVRLDEVLQQKEALRVAIASWVDQALWLAEARRLGLDKSAQARLVERQYLAALVKAEAERQVSAASISAEEIKDWVAANRGRYARAPLLRARHILLRTEAEAWEVRQRAERQNTDAAFAKLARLSSRDTERGGGDLGPFVRPTVHIPPAVFQAASVLQIGQLAGPVRSPLGWHVVRLTSRAEGYEPSVVDLTAAATHSLVQRKRASRYLALLHRLKTVHPVTLRPGELEAVRRQIDLKARAGEHADLPQRSRQLPLPAPAIQ